ELGSSLGKTLRGFKDEVIRDNDNNDKESDN
ncbi:MAG: twin-arginine translocase TatA/TatE family subunit, partial [Cyanobacteria bacterium J149]